MTAAVGMRSGGGSYSLDVSLRPQRIVSFTSEGFLLIFNILEWLIGLDDGIASFRTLYKNDPSIIDHVNQAGHGYIERLLMRPCLYNFERQGALLRLFIKDFGMKKGLDNISLLYSCAEWIGEGPHLALFDTLFDLGYDPSTLESPRPALWPKPSDPNWISETLTPDPFFIELMSSFVEIDPEFGGTSDLQYEILCHPEKALKRLTSPMYTLALSRNFLGQTPLHLAIAQSGVVSALLGADHPVDEVDIFGLTPLMYAAGLGKIESAKQLISAGADLTIEGGRFNRDFMTYAFAHDQAKFIVEIISHLQSTYPEHADQLGYSYGAGILIGTTKESYLPWISVDYVETLVKLAGNANITFHDPYKKTPEHKGVSDNHLLHYGWPLRHVQVFMKHGFSLLGHKNSIGETALMSATSRGDPIVTRYYIEMGAEVNDKDNCGMSALDHCLWGWDGRDKPLGFSDEVSYPEVARILMEASADTCSTDDCECDCSRSGCTVIHTLPAVFNTEDTEFINDDIWTTVEWLHLLKDCQSEDVLRSNLNSLLRRSLFEELGMTHTCCRRRRKCSESYSYILDHNTPTIDERIAIRAQQVEKSNQLDLEMQRMANLSSGELMSQWQQKIFQCHLLVSDRMGYPSWQDGLKAWYEHICNDETFIPKFGPLERSKPSGIWSVDEHGDTIVQTISCRPLKPSHVLPFSASLSYLAKLEHVYDKGGTGDNKGDRDKWYNRRLGWVLQFMEVLNVSQLYLRAGMQYRLKYHDFLQDEERSFAMMTHFLDSRASQISHVP